MLDNTLLRSNFVGRDGFRWWIGQIPPEDSQSGQINKEGWGNRVKVRIMGYHPFDDAELTNEDLPWAQVLLPTTSGSGAGNQSVNAKVQPADTVFGFFLDGDNAQLPVIVGVFGRTKEVSTEEYTSPFVPFTGYTSKIENDGSKLKADQTNEQTQVSQKSPYHIPPKNANSMDEISYFSGIGDVVQYATITDESFINKISVEIENVFKFIENIKSFNLDQAFVDRQIDSAVHEVCKKIQGIVAGIINGILNDTYNQMTPILNDGVVQLYDEVYNKMMGATGSIREAHLAGVSAQLSVTPAVQSFQNSLPGISNNIFNALFDIICKMLSGLLKSATNFAACLVDQFVGGLFNNIIKSITNLLGPVLQALSALLKFSQGFDLGSILSNSISGITGVPLSTNFGESPPNPADEVKQWTTGAGPRCSPTKDVSKILNIANSVVGAASEIAGTIDAALNVGQELIDSVGNLDIFSNSISDPNVKSSLSSCYGGPELFKLPPKVNVLGGKCNDPAIIKPVYGSLNEDTASIIGAVVIYGGSCYETAPTVELRTRNGYGAIIRTIINDKGSVIKAYVISDGIGYTPDPEYIASENSAITITDIEIINPGSGYLETDKVCDNLGNEYILELNNGSVSKVLPLNIVNVSDLPKVRMCSKTGKGAILKPIFGSIEIEGDTGRPPGREVQTVIDCITK
jgi:hypothetical protein